MHRTTQRLLFFALLTAMVSLAYGINYMYYSNIEQPPFGDNIRFWHGDTLAGPIRTNTHFSIMQDPVFFDFAIQHESDFDHGPGYSPVLWDIPPVFSAPVLAFPDSATWLRQHAFEQGYYFNSGPGMQAWTLILHDTMRVHWTEIGQPFDTLAFQDVILPDSADVFFEAPLRISGVVSTKLMIGASGRIGLEDNLLYASSQLPNGRPAPGHTEKLAVISENEIKVLNTYANGREHMAQGADIALNGIYVALNGNFTFDQHNVPDSGYYCVPCGCVDNGQHGLNPPACANGGNDERGFINLWGSLMQYQRNYVHRSCCNGTGYAKYYRYDNDLRYWNIHLFNDTLRENLVTPASLNFGSVMVGDTVWDTVRVYNDYVPVWLTNITTLTTSFITPADSDGVKWAHAIPVGFAPQSVGGLQDALSFDIPYYNLPELLLLNGTGLANAAGNVPQVPHEFSLSAYPNPFNSTAQIRFSLPNNGRASLILYDVQGRKVTRLVDQTMSAGEHTATFDGSRLGTGLYFAQLRSRDQVKTQKIMLIK